MYDEQINLMILSKASGEKFSAAVTLYDEDPCNCDNIKMAVTFKGQEYYFSEENYFKALLMFREYLQRKSMQLLCNGAMKEVYPSPMQMSMGCCKTGYIQEIGKQASNDNIVDLFEYEPSLTPATIEEQLEYHNLWLSSFKSGNL